MPNVTFPVILDRQDGSTVIEGELTAVGGLPPGTSAASPTVTGPDAFGASKNAGAASTYSRGDHNHGLPAAPPAVPAIAFEFQLAIPAGPYGAVGGLDANLVVPQEHGKNSPIVNVTMAAPATTYGAGAIVATYGACLADDIPDFADAYVLTVTYVVASLDGTEVASVTGTVTIPAGTATGSVAVSDLAHTATAGVDLVWDGTAGTLTTTAGGEFGILALFNAGWN